MFVQVRHKLGHTDTHTHTDSPVWQFIQSYACDDMTGESFDLIEGGDDDSVNKIHIHSIFTMFLLRRNRFMSGPAERQNAGLI